MRRVTGLFLLFSCLALTIGPMRANAAEPPLLSVGTVGMGAFDVTQDGVENPELGFELRFAPLSVSPQELAIRPTIGSAGTGLGSFWIYSGFRVDKQLGRLIITPGLDVALYQQGKGLDLGGTLEFRSSIESSIRIGNTLRAGVALYHLSNSRIYRRNPGSESLVLIVTKSLPSPDRHRTGGSSSYYPVGSHGRSPVERRAKD
jgi:hypothetical protein